MKHDHMRIRQLIRSGLTWSAVCERLGCSRDTVWRAVSDDPDEIREQANERKKRFRKRLRNGPNV